MPRRKPVHEALERLSRQEDAFLRQEFLAPVIRGGVVQVRIAGVVCTLHVEPRAFEGFGVFHPVSHSEALLVREAKLSERRQYLELFPQVRLVISRRTDKAIFGIPLNPGERQIQIEGEAEVHMAEEGE